MPEIYARGHLGLPDPKKPAAGGICDLCGERYLLSELKYQFEYYGSVLQNTGFLRCRVCLDQPQPQLATPILPPDPLPVFNPRPEPYAAEEGPPPPAANVLIEG